MRAKLTVSDLIRRLREEVLKNAKVAEWEAFGEDGKVVLWKQREKEIRIGD